MARTILAGTSFHGPKPFPGVEVLLYMDNGDTHHQPTSALLFCLFCLFLSESVQSSR